MSIDNPHNSKSEIIAMAKEAMRKAGEESQKKREQINKAIDKIRNGRSLLQVALDIHMTKTGSYERSEQDQNNDVATLIHVLTFWEPTVQQEYAEFDDAVKNLLTITVNEVSVNRWIFSDDGVIVIDEKALEAIKINHGMKEEEYNEKHKV